MQGFMVNRSCKDTDLQAARRSITQHDLPNTDSSMASIPLLASKSFALIRISNAETWILWSLWVEMNTICSWEWTATRRATLAGSSSRSAISSISKGPSSISSTSHEESYPMNQGWEFTPIVHRVGNGFRKEKRWISLLQRSVHMLIRIFKKKHPPLHYPFR